MCREELLDRCRGSGCSTSAMATFGARLDLRTPLYHFKTAELDLLLATSGSKETEH
jgi:hypothetical protein